MFDENTVWYWKLKNVDELVIRHHKDIKNSTNEKEMDKESSLTSCTQSSPSSSTNNSTSTWWNLTSFDDVYAKYDFA